MTQDDLTKLALIKLAQEQQQARVDVITVTLMREGINKHRARELADHFVNFTLTPPLPVQEPVAYDYHTKYDRGCYKCRSQFCPGNCIYTTPPLPVQEPLEQLRPAEFIQLTKGKEAVTGIPAYCWSEWLNKEQP